MNPVLRVLVVEDSEDDALLLLYQLRRGGYEPASERVDTAAGVTAALERQDWDIVLSDYSMPNFSALSALKLVQARDPDCPFIIVSGRIGEEDAVAAMKAGAHDYMMKGNWARLIPAVQRELREAEVRRERRRTETALRESEERFRLLVDGVKDYALFMMDPAGKVISWNTGAERIFGYTPDEIIGEPFSKFFPEEEVATGRCEQELKTAEIHGRFEDEGERVQKTGTRFWGNAFTTALRDEDGRLRGFARITCDVTERKRAKDQLEETNQKLSSLIQASPLAMIALDSNGLVRMWDPAAEHLFGWRAEEVLNKPVPVVPPEAMEEFRALLEGEMRGETRTALEMERVRRDGSRVEVSLWTAPLRDAQGAIVGTLGIYADITERKRAEEALRTSSERLQILSRRLLEVQETERRHLARELHDEIGQELTATKINLQAARDFPDPESLAARMEDSIRLVDRLLTQVRNLSLDLRPPLLDDLGLLAALRWYVDQQAQRTGLHTKLLADWQIERYEPDIETACFRVAQEAVTNVVRHARAKHLTVELRQEPDTLRLIVRDDGIGFDPVATQARAERGTSLGWLGMQERVSLVGGRLTWQSSPQQGTEVRACFPRRVRPRQPIEEEQSQQSLIVS